MDEIGVQPRALADDLLISDQQEEGTDTFEAGVRETLKMMTKMGAPVAMQKCALMATCKEERKYLRSVKWGPQDLQIPVEMHWRDLGAHMSMHEMGRRSALSHLPASLGDKPAGTLPDSAGAATLDGTTIISVNGMCASDDIYGITITRLQFYVTEMTTLVHRGIAAATLRLSWSASCFAR